MDELLQRVAEIRGMPASLIERSAQARAEKEGITVEAVLQEWAGEEAAAPAVTDDEQQTTDDDTQISESTSTDSLGPVEITTDYLVQLAADAKRMPPKLILSSATTRAEHGNTTLEAVLADWAGADLEELKQQAASAQATGDVPQAKEETEPAPVTEPAAPSVAPVAAAPVAGAMTMDELLEKVTEVKGMPAVLAKRSAEARSKKTGESVEEVLAEWAGVEASQIVAPPGETPEERSAPPETAIQPVTPEEPSGPEVIAAETPLTGTPEGGEPSEDETPVVRGGYPRWLAAAFVLIPLLAVTYILVTPNGPDCGTAGQLFVDPETGVALNCDGSEYGSSEINYMAEGAGIYSSQCVSCHSADGTGGAGPAFVGGSLLTTFPAESCSDQIKWITLGTAGWPDPTYGATDKPVGGFGLMPAFEKSLSEEQLASVALYERVQFGGQLLEEAEDDCGLVEVTADDEATTEASGS